MVRLDFSSDTCAPAAPEAMAALIAANSGYGASYGEDETTARAADLIRGFFDADAEVRFVAAGTAANAICLSTLCRPFEAALAHRDAHCCSGETGAAGFFGHGVGMIGLGGPSGRIDPDALATALAGPDDAHSQFPAVLSLTNATEYGAVYSLDEAAVLIGAAKEKGLRVHLDGARLANAVAAGVDPAALARLGIDMLVLGGAKAGMTPTEAIVIFDKALAHRLDARLKQAGQLPSKGRFLAAPFIGMLEDQAMIRHAAHANAMARRLADGLPFKLAHPVQTNGVFVQMEAASLARLHAAGWVVYPFADGSVRFITSWATTAEAVDEVCAAAAAG